MKSLVDLVTADLRRKAEWYGYSPTPKSMLRMLWSDGSSAQVLYRCAQWCQNHRLKPLAMLLYRFNAGWSRAVIGRGAEIGPGFVILHSIGVMINAEVRAGRNLVLEHGVTLGAEKGKSPVIGDDVFIGVGAVVIGDVRIGNRVKIGANAVVTKDLPDGATAVGIPARVIKIDGRRVDEPRPEPRVEAVVPSPVSGWPRAGTSMWSLPPLEDEGLLDEWGEEREPAIPTRTAKG